jgi:hypothetical protein
MENKILRILAFLSFCLCCITINATEKIPQDLQQLCAEYVAVKYTDVFIKSLPKNRDDYKKYVCRYNSVKEWDINRSHDSINNYIEWQKNNDFSKTCSNLTEPIMKRRDADINELLSISTKSYEEVCSSIKPQLKEDIEKYINEWNSSKNEVVPQKNTLVSVENNSKVAIPKQESYSIKDYLLWGGCALSLVNLVLLIVLFGKTNRNTILEIVKGSGRVKKMIKQEIGPTNIPMNNSQIDGLRSQFNRLNQSIIILQEELASLKQNAPNKPKCYTQEVPNQTAIFDTLPTNSKIVFAQNYRDGRLIECDESKAQYKIYVTNEGVSEFEFSGNLKNAQSDSDATFDRVCRLKGIGIANAKSYKTLIRGKVKRTENDWQVINMTEIMLS